ncbi:uncharacterized protein LOC107371000 [Tetranychus urticae]|nr:uncharacterized protein LOC107371000 [Tetranychus urticae]
MKFFMLTVCLFGTVFAKSLSTEWTPLPSDDPTVVKFANLAVADINGKEKLFYNKLIQIKEAKSSKAKFYVFKVIVGKTDCPIRGPYTDACQIKDDAPRKECSVYYYYNTVEWKHGTYTCDELKSS